MPKTKNRTLIDSGRIVFLPLGAIQPNPSQPRRVFDSAALQELAASIAQFGVLQPLTVRRTPDGMELVAGERRLRAARLAGLSEVPCILLSVDDEESGLLALIENLQRQDLNPMEEALGYRSLMDEYQMTQEEVAKVIGKSRPAIANSLRLLALPQPVAEWIQEGKLSAGHGRALLALEDEAAILEAAQTALKKHLNVRETEKMAQSAQNQPQKRVQPEKDHYYTELELALTQVLGRQVTITAKGKNKKLAVEFFDKDDLSALAARLCGDQELL